MAVKVHTTHDTLHHLLGVYANRMRVVRIIEHDNNKGLQVYLPVHDSLRKTFSGSRIPRCVILRFLSSTNSSPPLGCAGNLIQDAVDVIAAFKRLLIKRVLTCWVPPKRFPR
jgi:hypothetical protein